MIEIRKAEVSDIPIIMDFIHEHWKKDHIMAVDQNLFEFQHLWRESLCYVIAQEKETGMLYGILGYIPMNANPISDVSTVMIRALKNDEYPLLGGEMMRYLENVIWCNIIISTGISSRYAKIVDGLSENHIGKMNHYYRLANIDKYKVAIINHKEIYPANYEGELVPIYQYEEFSQVVTQEMLQSIVPYKDLEYLKRRYFQHPYFEYKFFGIKISGQEMRSILVVREVEAMGTKVMRIMDYLGNDYDLRYIAKPLDELMVKYKIEYVDFLSYGIDQRIMREAGFVLKKDNINIIPDHFDPFEQKNIDLYFYSWRLDGIHVYKAYGDQDRPNHIIEERKNE